MEKMKMIPVSEKVFVRLTKELATALDRYVEKRVRQHPGFASRSDAIRTCLYRCLEKELHEVETMNARAQWSGAQRRLPLTRRRVNVYWYALRSRRVGH